MGQAAFFMRPKDGGRCAECSGPLSSSPRPRRPRRYCSPTCRKARELCLRRMQTELRVLKRRLALLLMPDTLHLKTLSGRTHVQQIAEVQRALAATQSQLAEKG